MTSEGWGEMFEGHFADMCTTKFTLMLMSGPSGWSSLRRPGSEDPLLRSVISFDVLLQTPGGRDGGPSMFHEYM